MRRTGSILIIYMLLMSTALASEIDLTLKQYEIIGCSGDWINVDLVINNPSSEERFIEVSTEDQRLKYEFYDKREMSRVGNKVKLRPNDTTIVALDIMLYEDNQEVDFNLIDDAGISHDIKIKAECGNFGEKLRQFFMKFFFPLEFSHDEFEFSRERINIKSRYEFKLPVLGLLLFLIIIYILTLIFKLTLRSFYQYHQIEAVLLVIIVTCVIWWLI